MFAHNSFKVLILFLYFIVNVYCSIIQQYVSDDIKKNGKETNDEDYLDTYSYGVKLFYNAANSENSCRDSEPCQQWCKNWLGSNSDKLTAWSCDKYPGNFDRTCTCFWKANAKDTTYFDLRGRRDGPA